jgi:hypothetical protein
MVRKRSVLSREPKGSLKSECNREHIERLHKILALKGSPDVVPIGSETSGVMNRSGQKRLDDT